jgi:hypothetical protein
MCAPPQAAAARCRSPPERGAVAHPRRQAASLRKTAAPRPAGAATNAERASPLARPRPQLQMQQQEQQQNKRNKNNCYIADATEGTRQRTPQPVAFAPGPLRKTLPLRAASVGPPVRRRLAGQYAAGLPPLALAAPGGLVWATMAGRGKHALRAMGAFAPKPLLKTGNDGSRQNARSGTRAGAVAAPLVAPQKHPPGSRRPESKAGVSRRRPGTISTGKCQTAIDTAPMKEESSSRGTRQSNPSAPAHLQSALWTPQPSSSWTSARSTPN